MVSGRASSDAPGTAEVSPVPSTIVGEAPDSLKGRFFLAANGEAELFLNGKLLPLSDSATESLLLSKGDIVALRILSKFTRRTVRAAFLSDDLKWKWPFREADLSVFGDAEPTSISPSQFTSSLPRAGKGKTKDSIEALWTRLNLPAGKRMDLGRRKKCQDDRRRARVSGAVRAKHVRKAVNVGQAFQPEMALATSRRPPNVSQATCGR